ncbi:glycoside hydrolase family protein [Mucilaginibacter gracilis]|uniref:glycoside hydrolase family 88 protein n=1 Tax=Mucilaginibacter gracilis TaxID=423350 RepID=UPI001FE9A004|nr:glycoside hydrolase family 88 protein [Mucilaginibacter gracilis]
MKKIIALTALAITVVMFSFTKTETVPVQRDFKIAEAQYSAMIFNVKRFDEYPRTALPDGTLKNTDLQEWTSGFWPGSLWYLYEYTKDEKWKAAATRWTNTLAANQYNKTTHDLGFMMYCSYGNAYRLTGDKEYRDILIQSAKSLATRFDARVGCIRSWDPRLSWDGKTTWQFPVIIDNMMNLELLFFASKESGDPTYRNIAITHAETTMKNHIRPDFSSYHV